MSTNFYTQKPACACCGLSDPEYKRHIGKYSSGWAFAWRAYSDIQSIWDWVGYISNNGLVIVDEYGEYIPLEQFLKEYGSAQGEAHPTDWLSHDGGHFSDREFS